MDLRQEHSKMTTAVGGNLRYKVLLIRKCKMVHPDQRHSRGVFIGNLVLCLSYTIILNQNDLTTWIFDKSTRRWRLPKAGTYSRFSHAVIPVVFSSGIQFFCLSYTIILNQNDLTTWIFDKSTRR
jgi:hypothetical protein